MTSVRKIKRRTVARMDGVVVELRFDAETMSRMAHLTHIEREQFVVAAMKHYLKARAADAGGKEG